MAPPPEPLLMVTGNNADSRQRTMDSKQGKTMKAALMNQDSGNDNSGNDNLGYYNIGDYNSGYRNCGNRNGQTI